MDTKANDHKIKWGEYIVAAAIVGGVTAIDSFMFDGSHHLNVAMLYLLGIVFVATKYTMGPAIFTVIWSVACFDYFFAAPNYHFGSGQPRYFFSECVMLVVGFTINALAARLRQETQTAAKAKLEFETEKMRTAILSSVSHDLRTPLASITGAASALLAEQDNSEYQKKNREELLNSILNESERMFRLVHNLLDMTRIESGALKVKPQWCSIEEIVGAAIPHFSRRLSKRQLKISIPADLPLVELDEVLIEQVMVNLLDNALKYSPAGSDISISAKTLQSILVVSVVSQGELISAEESRKIFERFVRGKHDTTAGGFGLGLAICKSIITAHGGEIWTDSSATGETSGNSFSFSLPLGKGAPQMTLEQPELKKP
jgi:two-component system, OmpR family, sensor histidine kinase KdpD